MRTLFIGIAFIVNAGIAYSQKLSTPDLVDKVIGGVVTVGIYQSDLVLKPMGFRGNTSDLGYSKALDLSGARGSGSGFVVKYNNKYYIITNHHVKRQALWF